MIWENVKIALISIRSAKMRSFLTMLGMIIGVSSVVIIIAIGQGVKAEVSKQITDLGANAIFILPGKIISTDKTGKSTGFNPASSVGASTLTFQDVADIQKLKDITAVAPISLISGVVNKDHTPSPSTLVIATTPAYNAIRKQTLAAGVNFTDVDNTAKANVTVIGDQAKTNLFGNASALHQKITIRNIPFTVVGILPGSTTTSSMGIDSTFDNAIYIPITSAQVLAKGNVSIFRIMAEAKSNETLKPTMAAIKTKLLANHGGQEDFSVLDQSDLVSTVGDILSLLTTLIVAIASISLLVGGIGIMNIMLVSVTERTREIGIRKAIGATSRLVLLQFLIEAVTISLLGGLIGLGLAILEGLLVQKLAKITPVFNFQAFALAFGVSVAIGIIFGIAPAIKAARKRPIQALKYE